MWSIRKRRRQLEDGSLGPVHWQARYRDANGRSRSQSFARRQDAERFLERNGADLQRGEGSTPDYGEACCRTGPMSATTVRLRPNTRRGYWLLLQNHVLPHFGGRMIAAVDWMTSSG